MNKFIKGKIQEVVDTIESYEGTIKMLTEENVRLHDEHYKDAEMADMKRQLDSFREDYYRGFPLTVQQAAMINAWKKAHDAMEHNNPNGAHGVSGGGFAYIFYPTAIGTPIECRCNHCHRMALSHAASGNGFFDEKTYNNYMKKHNAIIEINDY